MRRLWPPPRSRCDDFLTGTGEGADASRYRFANAAGAQSGQVGG